MVLTILIGDNFLDGDSNPEYILFLLWILYSLTIKILEQPAVTPAYAPHSLEGPSQDINQATFQD